jgi:hypothetical protein
VSWLDDVLVGRRSPGLFSWVSPASTAAVERSVEGAGWRFVHLDTAAVADKGGFLAEAAQAFAFPAWFGQNWDAFADSLADIGAERGMLVLWEGWHALAEADERAFTTALEILRERAESAGGDSLVVLVRVA